jgi:poly(3-hydroxyalkanoate) synthetase
VCNSGFFDPDKLDYILKSSWLLDSGSTIHISHELYRFVNFVKAPSGDCVAIGGGEVLILGYNDVWIIITYRNIKRRVLLKHVAYCHRFISNFIAWDLLKKNGWKWDTDDDVL